MFKIIVIIPHVKIHDSGWLLIVMFSSLLSDRLLSSFFSNSYGLIDWYIATAMS